MTVALTVSFKLISF